MYKIVRIAQHYELAIVSVVDNPDAFLRYATWEINGQQPFIFHQIYPEEAQDYFSPQADGLGWETPPNQLFDTLDQVSRYILSQRFNSDRFFFDQDSSCHWYLVEASHRQEWEIWRDLDGNDPASWKTPPFAQRIDGDISQIEFEAPKQHE